MSEHEHDDKDTEEIGDHDVPADLVELHEILEWQAATEGEQ